MKNFYLLLVSTFMSLIAYGQVIITEIADPNDNALARYVEIYNVSGGDVDLTGWELRRWPMEMQVLKLLGLIYLQ